MECSHGVVLAPLDVCVSTHYDRLLSMSCNDCRRALRDLAEQDLRNENRSVADDERSRRLLEA